MEDRRKRSISPSPSNSYRHHSYSRERYHGSSSHSSSYNRRDRVGEDRDDYRRDRVGEDRGDYRNNSSSSYSSNYDSGKRYKSSSSYHSQPGGGGKSRKIIPWNELAEKQDFFTLKEFLDFQEENLPKSEATNLYAQYKQAYLKIQVEKFFQKHNLQYWFRELYDNSEKTRKKVEVSKLLESQHELFKLSLERGDFEDCCLESSKVVSEREEEGKKVPEETVVTSSRDSSLNNATTTTTSEGDKAESETCSLKSPTNKGISECNFTNLGLECIKFPYLCISSIPAMVSRSELAESIKKITEFKAILLGEACPEREFIRDGWIVFEEETDLQQTIALFPAGKIILEGLELDLTLPVSSCNSNCKIRTCPEVAGSEEKLRKDLNLATLICTKFAKESEIYPPFELTTTTSPQSDESIEVVKKKLDLTICYLRKVHFFCFYCGIQCEFPDDLIKKCGNVHIRKVNSLKNQQFSHEWLERHEMRILALLNQNEQLQIPPPEITLDAEVAKMIYEVEENKFRCTICSKLFRGPEFVDKHIRLKHPEKVEQLDNEIRLFTNFSREQASLYLAAPKYLDGLLAANSVPEHENDYRSASEGSSKQHHYHSSHERRRRYSRDDYHHHHHQQQSREAEAGDNRSFEQPNLSPLPPPPPVDDRRYEGRKMKTYVDLDAPIVGDVDLIY